MMILIFSSSCIWIWSGDCALLSNILSSVTFGLKTWRERLFPDVKKQPLGITGTVLCASLSSRQMLCLKGEFLWLSLTWPRWLVKAEKSLQSQSEHLWTLSWKQEIITRTYFIVPEYITINYQNNFFKSSLDTDSGTQENSRWWNLRK